MDIIYLRDIEVNCKIGVWRWERYITQRLLIDLEMSADVRQAAASDDLKDALDYKAVTDRVIAFVSGSEYQLIETLAENLAQILQQEFKIAWLRLRINKFGAITEAGGVGLVIERGQRA